MARVCRPPRPSLRLPVRHSHRHPRVRGRPLRADSYGRQGHSRPDACSVLWDNAQGPALGTAPAAIFWLALEQNGPWGARAATHSHLDPRVGAALEKMCQDAGGRLVLIRRPGTHPDPSDIQPRNPAEIIPVDPAEIRLRDPAEVRSHRVYLAGGLANRPWLLQADLEEPADLARLAPLLQATAGSGGVDTIRDAIPEFDSSPAPMLMVCSNSRRDVCCAVRGRPVALEAASDRPGQVWECSHTGGHRFAPTGVLLPYGQTFGRLSGGSAVAAVDAAMRDEVPVELMGPTYDRGRSHLTAAGQAAESTVRHEIQETRLLALSTTAEQRQGPASTGTGTTGTVWQCRVSHVDGRRWDLVAVREPSRDDLPESCGKEPVPTWRWSVVRGFGR